MNLSRLRTVAATLFAAATMTLSAQSFTVNMTDGSKTTYDINNVESIEFEDDANADPNFFKEPANTFIVTKGGEYSFYAKRPSGHDVEGVEKADWIWGSKTSDNEKIQSIVRNVRYEDGIVKFTASGNEGTAAIAGFDDAGTVVWVWLIWVTDRPAEIELASGTVVMDRYMGATSADPKDGTATWATVVYQWGRPVPIFAGFGEELGPEYAMTQAKRATIMIPDYGFEWKVSSEKAVSMEEGIANPTTFYLGGGNNNGNWLTTPRVPELWLTEKTDYDPSPAGYQIPVYSDWGDDFFSYITPYDDEGKTGGYYEYNGKRLFIPNGVKNRLFNTGENVIGYNGFMMWSAEYILDDYMGVLDNPNFPYTKEEAIEMGFIDYFPTRVIYQYTEGAMVSVHGVGNPAFAHPILCKRIKK